MSYKETLQAALVGPQPQTMPIKGRESEMKLNDAGGYAFKIDPKTYLIRFLVFGADSDGYYVNSQVKLGRFINIIVPYIEENLEEPIKIAAEFSKQGKILKNDTAIAILAIYIHKAKERDSFHYKELVEKYFNDIIRIPTHLYLLMSYVKGLRGWGRWMRNLISHWYLNKSIDNLAYHALKYQKRYGWSMRDVLRLAHPKSDDKTVNQIFAWATGSLPINEVKHPLFEARTIALQASSEKEVVSAIEQGKLTWEMLPTQWLRSFKVWEALIQSIPYGALLRNLGRLSNLVQTSKLDSTDKERFFDQIAEIITDSVRIKKSLIHPIKFAETLLLYKEGRGFRSDLTWITEPVIDKALEKAYNTVWESNIPAAGIRFLISVDTSGSMSNFVPGSFLRSMHIAGILASAIASVEPSAIIINFSDTLDSIERLTLLESGLSSPTEIYRYLDSIYWGGTDCSLPYIYALQNNIKVDAFLTITDNDTWYGQMHPSRALDLYRQKVNKNAVAFMVATETNDVSILDPKDPLSVEIGGFDAGVHQAMVNFLKEI